MKHRTSQQLFTYWNSVRDGRIAPRRFDIEPARIGSVLPDTFILERVERTGFHFRLAGTKLSERFGDGIRGAELRDGWDPDDGVQITRHLAEVTELGGVLRIEFEATTAKNQTVLYEMLLLPLVHTQGTIDRILGSIAALREPDGGPVERAVTRKLVASEVIWPDGRPHALLQTQQRQAPFLPHIRTARIVRQDRRQFRVYDGGLDKPAE